MMVLIARRSLSTHQCGSLGTGWQQRDDSVKIGDDSVKIGGDSVKIGGDSVKIGDDSVKIGGDRHEILGVSSPPYIPIFMMMPP